jgi:hypothetical protein
MTTVNDIDPPQPVPNLDLGARAVLRSLIAEYGAPQVIKALSEIIFGDLRRLGADEQYRAVRYAGKLRQVSEGLWRDL